MSKWKSYEDLREPAMRMRLTKAPWLLLLLLLYIFPSLLHCPRHLSHFAERSATILSNDSPMIDLEQGHDCPVNKVGPVLPQGFAVLQWLLLPSQTHLLPMSWGHCLGWKTNRLTMHHSYRISPFTKTPSLLKQSASLLHLRVPSIQFQKPICPELFDFRSL